MRVTVEIPEEDVLRFKQLKAEAVRRCASETGETFSPQLFLGLTLLSALRRISENGALERVGE